MKRISLSLFVGALSLCTVVPLGTVDVFAETQPPIKIGATLALSGKLAFVGTAQRQGLELAIEDINAGGGINGREVKLVLEDNAGDAKTALAGVNKLVDVDSVDVLFTAFSHITQAVKERAKRAGKIMIYAASLSDVAKESPLFFRDWGDAESEGSTLVKALVKVGHKRVAFLTETSEGCAAIERSFNGAASAAGLTIVAQESYAPGETDFKALLLRISQKKPDALATCTWRDGALLMPQLKSVGLQRIPTFQFLAPFLPAADSAEMRALFEENGAVSVWLGFVESQLTPAQTKFFDRLKTRFQAAPRFEAALAFDDMIVLAQAMRSCPSVFDSACVAEKLSKTVYEGAAGALKFDEFRRSNRPDLLIKVKDGKWELM